MNAHEAAMKNSKLALVRAGKAYDRTFEVRPSLPTSLGHCPKIISVKPTAQKPMPKSKTVMRANRWSQTVTYATNAPRAIGVGSSANVPSMFGRPLARREG